MASFLFYLIKKPAFLGRDEVVFDGLADYRFRRTPALGLTIVLYIVPKVNANSVNAFGRLPIQM